MQTEIILEDEQLLVCYKPAGIATQTKSIGQMDVESELRNYLKGREVYVVHRLDQPVEGLLVFAKTKEAAAALSKQLNDSDMNKSYVAVVYKGEQSNLIDETREIILQDYLVKDKKGNCSRVASKETKDAKLAKLSFQVIKENADIAYVKIHLFTGRHHQIRVQFASKGLPLLGDTKYGTKDSIQFSKENGVRNVALCANELHFVHPKSKKKMEFGIEPKGLLIL